MNQSSTSRWLLVLSKGTHVCMDNGEAIATTDTTPRSYYSFFTTTIGVPRTIDLPLFLPIDVHHVPIYHHWSATTIIMAIAAQVYLLYVVVAKSTAFLELLGSEDQPLLARRDACSIRSVQSMTAQHQHNIRKTSVQRTQQEWQKGKPF